MVNDISPVKPNSCQLVKFADDISFIIPIRECLIDTSPLGVNNIVNSVQFSWSAQNNMKLNLKKTWEMVIYELILHLLSCFRCCFLDTIL